MVANPAELSRYRPAAPAVARRMAVRRLVFYVGVPLAFSIYLTFSSGPLLEDPGYLQTFAFYMGHSLPPWLVTAFMTGLAMRLLAPWRPGLVLLATIGSIASCLVTLPYVNWLSATFDWSAYVIMRPPFEGDAYILFSLVKATVIWVVVNLIFDRYFGLPRYRYATAPDSGRAAYYPSADSKTQGSSGPGIASANEAAIAAMPADTAPREHYAPPFLARLGRPIALEDLLAIKSEQHYLQIIGRGGRQLVLYRLGDAIHELPPELGVQVHRSWWVAHRAMKALHSQGRRMTLELDNGTHVPVSIPHQQLVRQLLVRRAGAG